MKLPFQISTIVPERAIGADGTEVYEMSVQPLSVLLVTLRPLNDTGTLANYARYRAICAAVENLTLSLNGQSIISMRGEDIAAFNWLRWGIVPEEANPDNVDNERRAVVLPIILGKQPFDKSSCFPATSRGQFTLSMTYDIADTGYDGLRVSVEGIELPDANPKEYERRVTIQQTFGATGNSDVELVPGNPCRGIMLFGTTGFGGASPAPSWGNIRVLVDNMEAGYAGCDWEVLKSLTHIFGRQPYMGEHKHTVNAAGAGVEETASVFDIAEDFTNYVYLDYDYTRDDQFTLDVSDAKRFTLRANAETADAIRAVQVEVVDV